MENADTGEVKTTCSLPGNITVAIEFRWYKSPPVKKEAQHLRVHWLEAVYTFPPTDDIALKPEQKVFTADYSSVADVESELSNFHTQKRIDGIDQVLTAFRQALPKLLGNTPRAAQEPARLYRKNP